MMRRCRDSADLLASVALVLLALFPLALIVLNIIQRDHYDALTQPGSQLALGQDGWLLTLGFCGLALGSVLLAWLLQPTLPKAPSVSILIAIAGALNLIAAVVHTDANGAPMTTHGLIHNMAGLLSFLLFLAALIMASRAFRSNPAWASFGNATRIWAIGAVVATLLMFGLSGVGYFGLGQRIALTGWLSWLIVVAWHVRATRPDQATSRVAH